MKQVQDCKILKKQEIAKDVYFMSLEGSTGWIKPGKFFNIKIEGKYLRRPMSVCTYDSKSFSFIFKVLGEGTDILSKMNIGQTLNILLDLGNGYTLKDENKILLVSGGLGLPSIFPLVQELSKRNKSFVVVAAFKTKADVFYEKEIRKYAKDVIYCTDDGTYGEKGTVVDIIKRHNLQNHYYYACGSMGFLMAIFKTCKKGQLSLEARMGCGYGVCMGCSMQTTLGPKRICVDGPIFESEILKW